MLSPPTCVHDTVLAYFVRTRLAIVEGAFFVSLGLAPTHTARVLEHAVIGTKGHSAGGLSCKSVVPSLAPLQWVLW